ncbi:hypothetical protein THAOC_34559 [Thalassiosira oceanica]|uniref:Exonuclease 1 n=1 Tax=Thalassiosira oceanica TaxID=159749 RepID=K0RCI0_THAOC|nr:hypothetical protein THAOC_34559 [Thalassiosira oceanica]|eukprot:EJK46761.1 hypothetical protein THAOC_34559 [Thalassiosira oceanica]
MQRHRRVGDSGGMIGRYMPLVDGRPSREVDSRPLLSKLESIDRWGCAIAISSPVPSSAYPASPPRRKSTGYQPRAVMSLRLRISACSACVACSADAPITSCACCEPLHIRGGGVKQLWRQALGNCRDSTPLLLKELGGLTFAVDVSSWVHKLDVVHEVAYARTSTPTYPHKAVQYYFLSKHTALTDLGIKLIYVFDGVSPDMKKNENLRRQGESRSARDEYKVLARRMKDKVSAGEEVTDEEREHLLGFRRKMARPTPEDYASLAKWMSDNGMEFVQAPFEADAQMKQLANEGDVSGAITEDGDLVIYEMPCILSKAKIDSKLPEKSSCQCFHLDKLKDGTYNAELKGKRIEYMAELACLLGCDFIGNIAKVGPAKIFAADCAFFSSLFFSST